MMLKSQIKNLEHSDIGLLEGTKFFINKSSCPYYKSLKNKFKKLFFTVFNTVKAKYQNTSLTLIKQRPSLALCLLREYFNCPRNKNMDLRGYSR